MSGILIAGVAVSDTAFHFDKLFDYQIPIDLVDKVGIGQRVLVPFGKGNSKRLGIICELHDTSELEQLKPIIDVVDKEPLLNDEMIELGKYISEHTFCTLFDSLKVMLPAGTAMKIVTKYSAMPDALKKCSQKGDLNETEFKIVEALVHSRGEVERDRLAEIYQIKDISKVLDKLCSKSYIKRIDSSVRKVGDATVKMAMLSESYLHSETDIKLTPKQKSVVKLLEELGSASIKEICYFTGVTAVVVTGLEKKGIVETFDEEVYRNPYSEKAVITSDSEITLTDEQNTAYEALLSKYQSGNSSASLLYGVTGSGKTSIYIKLIDKVIEDGRGVIVMVPEISLTPQTLDIFHRRYGSRVAVFHSGLSLGQRMDEWKRVKNKDALIAVGTRSAVFAPFDDLGLIIIDEEQEATYKSEQSPRFHARDVARFRANYHNTLLVLASATPSIDSFVNAKKGRYQLCTVMNRYNGAPLPEVITVDMRNEELTSSSNFSMKLLNYLKENLENNEQSILLLNRRGYNTFASCRSCGEVLTCPNCSISLTYHSANNRLMCHYCGYSTEFTQECPSCHSRHMRFSGVGTQKIEDELSSLLPQARILRMDADSTATKFAHEKKLGAFKNGEYDIMLGTQMVAKGLDFPNVTTVGVINTDSSLYSNDYRSLEQTFSLLTQVIGRAGRGDKLGRAVIQTYTPENPVIPFAANQDYDGFFASEIAIRKLLTYPPYCDLFVINFISTDEYKAKSAAKAFFDGIRQKLAEQYSDQKMILLGPSPAAISKIGGKYHYMLTVKCHNNKRSRSLIRELMQSMGRNGKYRSVTVTADINPYYF